MTKTFILKKIAILFSLAMMASGCSKASLKKVGPVATAPGAQQQQQQQVDSQPPAVGQGGQPWIHQDQPRGTPVDVIRVPGQGSSQDEIPPVRPRGSRTVVVNEETYEIPPIAPAPSTGTSGVVVPGSQTGSGCTSKCGALPSGSTVIVAPAVPSVQQPEILPVTQQPVAPVGQRPPITQPVIPPVTQPIVQQPVAPILPVTQQPVAPLPTVPVSQIVKKCVEETFEQNAGQNKLDILVVSETRILANQMGQKLSDAIAAKLVKSYQDRCADIGQYSSIRVGFLPAVSKLSPLHGKLAEIKYKLVDREKQQFVLESEKLKTEQLATSIRMNFSFNSPQDQVVSGHPIPGGNAGLASLTTLLNENVELAKTQGLFRENAALHIIFVSSRADLCAITAPGSLTGSQNEALRAATCKDFNMSHLIQSIEKVVPRNKLVSTSIVGLPGQKVLQVTQTPTGQPLMYKPGIGYGYTELMEKLDGQVVDFEKPEEMTQAFTNVKYNLDGGNTLIETFFDTQFAPLAGSSSVWAIEPFDPRTSTLNKCRDLQTAGAKCLNTKKTVCSLGTPGCTTQSGLVSKEWSGTRKGVQVLGGYFLPKSKVHVSYCYAVGK